MIIMGPPGAGKGTQASTIASAAGVPAISTGEIFRRHVAEKTELGTKVAALIEAGEYVPDELTNELVASRLSEDDAQEGFLLDGYPRNPAQVAKLDEILEEMDTELDLALELVLDRETLVERLLGRAKTEGRADDTEEVIRRRMEVYEEQTRPISDIYASRGILRQVDGDGSIEEVAERLAAAISDRSGHHR
ncbi:MAG: adenylate kinase [Flaviflexus sp.]|nr:adenylate kinase [Flaviflexus sp.]